LITHRRRRAEWRRAVVGAAALLAASVAVPQAAGASSGGSVRRTTAASSTAWGVVIAPTTVTTAPSCPSSPYCSTYSFTLAAGSTGVYFNAWNTGAVAITGLSFLPTFAGTGTIKMFACSVAWKTTNDTCPGTKTRVFTKQSSGTYIATTTAGTYPAAVGGETFLQVLPATPKPGTVVVTLSTSVCSGGAACKDGTVTRQIRAAKTTNA
jgi:hypothetical protein